MSEDKSINKFSSSEASLELFYSSLCCIQNSSNAYTHMIWWPVSDNASSVMAAWLRSFIDAFAMPLLFYKAAINSPK